MDVHAAHVSQGMIEGSLPLAPRNLMPNSIEFVEHLEEERRLCYVSQG